MTRRVISITVIVITALLLQSTVFSQLELLGVKPELMYLVVILIAILEGPTEGVVVGFVGGMAEDFLLDLPKGLTALTLTLLGYGMGLARQYITSPSPLLPTTLVAIGTALGLLFYQTMGFLLGQIQEPITTALKVTLLASLYNAVLTPIVFPLIRRLVEGSRPTRVVRF